MPALPAKSRPYSISQGGIICAVGKLTRGHRKSDAVAAAVNFPTRGARADLNKAVLNVRAFLAAARNGFRNTVHRVC